MKRILLFSCGMDSFLLKSLMGFENSECLFVGLGTDESYYEEKLIDYNFPHTQKARLPISAFELDNKIIPFRNHMLALMAAQFSNNIYFGFTAGDTTKDKDYVFKAQMESSMNYFASDAHKVSVPDYPYQVHMPYKDYTKGQLVKMYLDKNLNISDLIDFSRSCYSKNESSCGTCRSCLRRFVALFVNEVLDTSMPTPSVGALKDFAHACAQKNRGAETQEVEKCITLLQQ